MELTDAIAKRRMVRSFSDEPVDSTLVEKLLADAGHAPQAGNTDGTAWLLLQGPEEIAPYWECTTTPEWRATSPRWAGLSKAPVVALSLTSSARYLSRYNEPDKASSGLGDDESAWPIPYWFGDAAYATMVLLLRATDVGLGACFLGNFRGESELLAALGVPDDWRLFGSVLLGHPDDRDHRSPSLDRPRTRPRVHQPRWDNESSLPQPMKNF